MTLLPVVERELRVAARRRATHWMRFLAALAVVSIGCILLIGSGHRVAPHQLSRMVFHATGLVGFGFCLLAGTFLTADSLGAERREGTLGLLFLTDLRGHDVVLGKLAASSAVAVYAMLAILPVLGLPLLMGGVSPGEFGRLCLALVVTLMLSLGSGLLVSAVCRESRTAMVASFGIMLALTGGLFLVGWTCWALTRVNPLSGLMVFSPLGAYVGAFETGVIALARYWQSIWILGSLAVVQVAAASWLLPRRWRDRTTERPTSVPHRVPGRERARGIALERNPFGWLAGRDGFPRPWMRLTLVLLFAVWLGCFVVSYASRRSSQDEWVVTCLLMAFGLHVVMKGLVAVQASRRLSEDRASGALELLLATPLRPERIVEGQWSVLRRQFGVWLGILMVLNFLLLLRFILPGTMHINSREVFIFSSILLGGAVLVYTDFLALGWTGMALGLRGLRHPRAVLGTLLRVILPPWGLLFLFIFLSLSGGPSREAVITFHIFWWLGSLGLSLALASRHRQEITCKFRSLAAGEKDGEKIAPGESAG